jgi:DNA methylase
MEHRSQDILPQPGHLSSALLDSLERMGTLTQEALYAAIDQELSWSEAQLPERERTKHVHRLHPYLGKFVPQLAETLLRRRLPPAGLVYDPFAGSGTTLVEASVLGMPSVGTDVSAFNCLLMRVKTASHDLHAVSAALDGALARPPADPPRSEYLETWYHPQALAELAGFCSAIPGSAVGDVLSVVASRAARSARCAAHHDLDFPSRPMTGPYWCHKHRRECRPVADAARFLRRYAADTLRRLAAYAELRRPVEARVLHADAREADLPGQIDGVVTSPPYPGVIDYHEQHRYAYELLGLDDRRDLELGAAAAGHSRRALRAYSDGMAEALAHTRRYLRPGAPVAIVANDRHDLYDAIAQRAGFRLVERTLRHVNRRTGRRAGEYYEQVMWLEPRPATPAG